VIAEAASWDSSVEISEILRRLERFGEGGGPAGPAGPGGGGGVARGDSGRAERGVSAERRAGGGRARDDRGTGLRRDRLDAAPAGGREAGPESGPRDASSRVSAGTGGDFIASPRDAEPSGGNAEPSGRAAEIVSAVSRARSPEQDPLAPLGGRETWERFISQIREAKLTLGIWLLSAEVKGLDGDRLFLSFSPQNRFASEMIAEERNRRYIETHLERFFGKKLTISTGEPGGSGSAGRPRIPDGAAGDSTAPGPNGSRRAERRAAQALDPAVERFIEGQPVIKHLIDEFEGEIIRSERSERRS
jgi:hypothetical protein